MTTFHVKDRVRRKRGSRAVGTIESIIHVTGTAYYDPRTYVEEATVPAPRGNQYRAVVCWQMAVRPNCKSGKMTRSIELKELELVEESER